MRIFVDTNIFVSLKDLRDSNYTKANQIFEKYFLKTKNSIVISEQIFGEALTVLSQKTGKKIALNFLDEVLAFEIIELTKEDVIEAVAIFKKTKTKNISFADCTTIALCRKKKYKIDALFSFDKHFEVPGIKLLHKILK